MVESICTCGFEMLEVKSNESLSQEPIHTKQCFAQRAFAFVYRMRYNLYAKLIGLKICMPVTVYSHFAEGFEWQLIIMPNAFECNGFSYQQINDIECALKSVLSSRDHTGKWKFCVRLHNDDFSFAGTRLRRAYRPAYKPVFDISCERAMYANFPSFCHIINVLGIN